jgi:hypothetical protein
MASEIVVTVGADTTQLEKGLQDVAKQGSKASTQATSFASILGRAYGIGQMLMSAIMPIFDFMMKYAEKARELRNISVATGVPTEQLQKWNVVAQNAGMSLSTLSHSMAEFNKKMGDAKIRGSEANAALTKLGFGMKDIGKESLRYQDALYALADAHKAGTDNATLMHYGTQLFGSSFEQMLPLVKQGSGELKKQLENVATAEEENARGAARFADMMTRVGAILESVFIDIVGTMQNLGEGLADAIDNFANSLWYNFKGWFGNREQMLKDAADATYRNRSSGHTAEEDKQYYEDLAWRYSMGDDEKEIFLDRIKELQGGADGKKLSPLGLSEAQGASSLQQMGGGDIASAIAFTPMERIATATEQTAANTDPKNAPQTVQGDPQMGSKIALGF